MPGIQNNAVVQALSSRTAHKPFGYPILPRGSRGGDDFLDDHGLHFLLERLAIDAVPVVKQILGRRVIRKRVDDLLAGPLRGAVGDSVTLICQVDLRSCEMMKKTKSKRKVAVGTVGKSQAAMPFAWFSKNVFHVCDGGFEGRYMYFETVV